MAIYNPYGSLIINRQGSTPVHYRVASNKGAELCYVHGADQGSDPKYWFLDQDGYRATLGVTGLVDRVHVNAGSGARTLLFRPNGYGKYQEFSGSGSLDRIIDGVYQRIRNMEFLEQDEREVFNWSAQQVSDRFGDVNQLINPEDIIPEFNDTMIVVKVSDRCARACNFCPESGNLYLYPAEKIRQNMDITKRVLYKYHGQYIARMTEGMINGSDLLWFKVMKATDPLAIVEMFYKTFPHLQKVYAFMGVPNINKVSEHYLRSLFNNARGVNRVLVGIETADDKTSRLIGKNETAKEKREAVLKLIDAGFRVKPIIQVGVVGEGFSDSGRFISVREGLEKTVELLGGVLRGETSTRPDKVLISRYVPVAGTVVGRWHQDGTIKSLSKARMEEEVAWVLEQFWKKGIPAETDYEIALQDEMRLDRVA